MAATGKTDGSGLSAPPSAAEGQELHLLFMLLLLRFHFPCYSLLPSSLKVFFSYSTFFFSSSLPSPYSFSLSANTPIIPRPSAYPL